MSGLLGVDAADENSRKITINLDFLDASKTYNASFYEDGEDAHWDRNPTAINIESMKITASDKLELDLAPGGGVAISFMVD